MRFPNMRVTNYFETSTNSYQTRFTDTHDGAINITHIVRNHSLRYGVGYRSYRENKFDFGSSSGTFTFGTTYVNGPLDNSAGSSMGQSLAALLLGLPSSGSIDLNDNYAERVEHLGHVHPGRLEDQFQADAEPGLALGIGAADHGAL